MTIDIVNSIANHVSMKTERGKHGNKFQLPSKEELDELESAKILFVHGVGFSRQVISAFGLLKERPFIVLRWKPVERSDMGHIRNALSRASKKFGIPYGSRLLQHDREWIKVWNKETYVDTPPARVYAPKQAGIKNRFKVIVLRQGGDWTVANAELGVSGFGATASDAMNAFQGALFSTLKHKLKLLAKGAESMAIFDHKQFYV